MPSTAQVDYTLRNRRQLREAFEGLAHRSDLSPMELEAYLAEFLAREEARSVLFSFFRSRDEAVLTLLAFALQMMNEPEIVLSLLEALLDPSVPEITKLHLLPVLEYYQVDLEDPQILDILAEAFGGLEVVVRHSTEHMLDTIQRDNDSLHFLLESFRELPSDVRIGFVRQFGETRDERAARLLALLVRTDDVEAACEAARYLGRIRSPRSAAELTELLQEPHPTAVTAQLQRSLQRLRLMQIQASHPAPQPVSERDIHRVCSSYIENSGHRILWFTWRYPKSSEQLAAISLMLHSEFGLQDCFGTTRMDRSEYEEIMQAMRHEAGCADVDYEYALTLLRDALWCNYAQNHPIPAEFALWKPLLQDGDLTPTRYEPDWEAWGIDVQSLRTDVKWLAESGQLHEHHPFSNWFDQSPRTRYYYTEIHRLGKDSLDWEASRPAYQELMKRYAAEVFETKRALIQRNLELSADLLLRLGRRELAIPAIAAALALADASCELHQHPFILRMMYKGLYVAASRATRQRSASQEI